MTEDAQFTAAIAKGGTDRVQETRDGETRAGRIGSADLYTGLAHPAVDGISVDNADPTQMDVVGDWETVTSPPGGFLEHDLLRAAPDTPGHVAFRIPIHQSGRFEVAMRWINQISSPIRYATEVPVEIVHAQGTETLRVNQRRQGGVWNRLGVFPFEENGQAEIIIRTTGANGHVQADGVRLLKLP